MEWTTRWADLPISNNFDHVLTLSKLGLLSDAKPDALRDVPNCPECAEMCYKQDSHVEGGPSEGAHKCAFGGAKTEIIEGGPVLSDQAGLCVKQLGWKGGEENRKIS